jgi:hypothetical protein
VIVLPGKLVPARRSHPSRTTGAYRRPVHVDDVRLSIYNLLLGTALFDPLVGYEARGFGSQVVSYAHIRALFRHNDFALAVLRRQRGALGRTGERYLDHFDEC